MKNIYLLKQNNSLKNLHTAIRCKDSPLSMFVHKSDRIIRLLLEQAFDLLPYKDKSITTPINAIFNGVEINTNLCGVSIIRAGDSMASQLRLIDESIPIGKILLQRDRVTKQPCYYYSNLPEGIENFHIFLLEPMLATGGSAIKAIDILLEKSVKESNIILINFISSPVGIERVNAIYPDVKIVTSSIEEGLNKDSFMIPGIGDFGDRYFGTK